MLQRFCGPAGRTHLVEVLAIQPIIGGYTAVAKAISGCVEVESFNRDSSIIEESAPDNDLYFILAGVVSVRVSGREIAVRTAGQHIGEMALLDPGRSRSAAAVADGEVVVARIPAAALTELADANPRLWRNVARVLAERLRERNRFVRPANPRPVMFVGCSTESLSIGRAIQSVLEHDPIVVRVWTDDTFKASQFPVESLERELAKVDFAAFVLSPDDTVISRGSEVQAPRDNLVFELGLCMGALGHSRTFLLHPRGSDIKIPTDLASFTPRSAAGADYFCRLIIRYWRYRIDYRPASQAIEAEEYGRKETGDGCGHCRDERAVSSQVAVRFLAVGDQTGALVAHSSRSL